MVLVLALVVLTLDYSSADTQESNGVKKVVRVMKRKQQQQVLVFVELCFPAMLWYFPAQHLRYSSCNFFAANQ